jgi:hypothetical protein
MARCRVVTQIFLQSVTRCDLYEPTEQRIMPWTFSSLFMSMGSGNVFTSYLCALLYASRSWHGYSQPGLSASSSRQEAAAQHRAAVAALLALQAPQHSPLLHPVPAPASPPVQVHQQQWPQLWLSGWA